MSNQIQPTLTEVCVAYILNKLSKEELVELGICMTYMVAYSAAANHKWVTVVQPLFAGRTEGTLGGEVSEAISTFIVKKLQPEAKN